MGKIFLIMGKSATGKDTIYRRLLERRDLCLLPLLTYTTRPIRDGETDGVQYHFTDEAGLSAWQKEGRVIELREYHTVHGSWKYFTVDDGSVDLALHDYLLIGTLESLRALRRYFGERYVAPILITLDDAVRLQRALNREKKQENPRYREMCRRYLADEEDFSAEKIEEAGIERSFANNRLQHCLAEIAAWICGEETGTEGRKG